MKIFLKWFLILCLSIAATVLAYDVGLVEEILQKDFTKISLAIFSLYAFATLYQGVLSWKATYLGNQSWQAITDLKGKNEWGWFISAQMLSLGMVGTIIGFVFVLKDGFADLDPSKVETIQQLLTTISVGMGTALYTTLIGLVLGMALKLQCFIVSLEIQKHTD